jgi:hypothetical protein
MLGTQDRPVSATLPSTGLGNSGRTTANGHGGGITREVAKYPVRAQVEHADLASPPAPSFYGQVQTVGADPMLHIQASPGQGGPLAEALITHGQSAFGLVPSQLSHGFDEGALNS